MKTFKIVLYDIPEDKKERFDYLKDKIKYALDNNWKEMYNGYSVMLGSEFKKYKVKT